MRVLRFAFFVIGLFSGLTLAHAKMTSALLPHRAVYDLALGEASDRSGINAITGRMVYEFAGSACEGYTVTFRFVMRIDSGETMRLSDQQTTTYEDGAGETFHFVSRIFLDNELDKEVRGTASTSSEGIDVAMEKPAGKSVMLEPSQFPTAHLKELLAKAVAGKTFYQTTLFDGSDDADKVMMTAVTIGKPKPVAQDDPERGALKVLAGDTFWPVAIAYFDREEEKGEETPDYSIAFKLHESGVTRELTMDYDEFSILGKLVDLTMFEQKTSCTD